MGKTIKKLIGLIIFVAIIGGVAYIFSGAGVNVATRSSSSGDIQLPDSVVYLRTTTPIRHQVAQETVLISSTEELGALIDGIPYDFSRIGGQGPQYFAMYDAQGNSIPLFAGSAYLNAKFSPGFFSKKALVCIPYSCPLQNNMVMASNMIKQNLPQSAPAEGTGMTDTTLATNANSSNTSSNENFTYTADFKITNKPLNEQLSVPSNTTQTNIISANNLSATPSETENASTDNSSAGNMEYWVLLVPVSK